MLIKEYRIPLPLSVEEYRIAQLYMIAKKSRVESEGHNNGVEILINEPYLIEETGERGQYTKKNFYVAEHLPNIVKGLVSSKFVIIEEEAWNAYPYTKTVYTCSLFSEKTFRVEIETRYFNEPGLQKNVFNLSSSEMRNMEVDYVDIVRDELPKSEYTREEDPLYYASEKTGRGTLTKDWLEEYTDEYNESVKKGSKPRTKIMCAYKLCKVHAKIWGVERYIHDFARRKFMVRAHKQAWVWQDEWFGLTMDDIREIEKETQRILEQKMRGQNEEEDGAEKKKKTKRRSSSIRNADNDLNIVKWRIDRITNDSDESDGEYFDAKETTDATSMCKWSSLEYVNKLDEENASNEELANNRLSISRTPDNLSKESLAQSNPDKKTSISNRKCPYSVLIFVLHGGHLLDTGSEFNNKFSDFLTLKSTFEQTVRTAYSNLTGRLVFKLVSCPLICKSSLQFLSKLSSSYQKNGKFDYENLPIDCLPLFATNQLDYLSQIEKTINSINQSYKEFIETDGKHFDGQVSFICDSLGGVLAYDSLCKEDDDCETEEGNSNGSLKFDFKVNDLFLFGCPLSLILAYRKLTSNFQIQKPKCSQVYNLFHSMDRMVMRLEPLIESKFSEISSISVPKYSKQVLLQQIISIDKHLKFNQHLFTSDGDGENQEQVEDRLDSSFHNVLQQWWGLKRIDYELHCSHGISHFPNNTLPILFHSRFWESNDVASFVLDKLMYEVDPDYSCQFPKLEDQVIDKPKEKWLKKSTSYKIKNIRSNHRANDLIVKEGQEQILVARFMYGPLDVVTLAGEKVDIYILKDMNKDDWTFLGTEITDRSGKVHHSIQDRLACGLYPVKMVVKGDHSSIDLFLTVLPPLTECVVFSIDGSFTASISVTGKDPKVRPGAVDVVRFWQELGYLIIYITGRPGFQQQRVLSWLSEHNFPHGLIYFTGGLTTDPLKHKAMYLEALQAEVQLQIYAAYGSAKDIWIYQSLGLNKDNIFIMGRVSKKQQHLANIIIDGYANHLEELKQPGYIRRANNKIQLPKGNFGLCNFITGFTGIRLRKKNRTSRKASHPFSNSNSCASTPRLSNKFHRNNHSNTLNTSNNSTLNSYKSISVSHSPTASNTSSNLFTSFFHNRSSSKFRNF